MSAAISAVLIRLLFRSGAYATVLVDSHCHLDRVNLKAYDKDFGRFMEATQESGVGHMLCVSIDLEHYPKMRALIDPYPRVSVSVGVHPNERYRRDPEPEELVELAADSRNVAIGETGLDYYRSEGDLQWQHRRFRNHIAAARACGKPLIVHTRDAREDTIRILREEQAADAGGVLHCFTEDWAMASRALDLGFYISFSGIVTFNNAEDLREVASKVPLDRVLIETDCPYLTPVPHRGRPNEPRYVSEVAGCIAGLRKMETEELVAATGENFFRLFKAAVPMS
jgi:TatD DNase family protein